MRVFRYDKTFEGLLTAVFYAYTRRQFPDVLIGENDPLPLFADEPFTVCTDTAHAERVWKGLERKVRQRELLSALTAAWLSELPDADTLIFRYIRKIFDYPENFAYNLGDADVLRLNQIWRKVNRESSYVIQFLRFQKTADGIYFAALAPLYDVLPLTLPHLTDRFADQLWLLYDIKRGYGYFYDGKKPEEVRFADPPEALRTGKLSAEQMAEGEKDFQQLWQTYFQATAIRERLNPRLQRQNLPARFWPYLVEVPSSNRTASR